MRYTEELVSEVILFYIESVDLWDYTKKRKLRSHKRR